MKREGAGLRTFHIVAIALLLLALSLGLFSYFYVVGKQDYLSQRDFRLLGVASAQLKQRIENYTGNVLWNLVDDAMKGCETQKPDPCGIKVLPDQAQRLQMSGGKRPGPGGGSGQSEESRAGVPAGGPAPSSVSNLTQALSAAEITKGTPLEPVVRNSQEWLTASLGKALSVVPNLKLAGGATLIFDPTRTIQIALKPMQNAGSFQLAFDCQRPVGDKGYAVKFRAVTRMDDLVGNIASSVFDDVLIVRQEQNDNAVIYQQAQSGPRLTKLGTVVNTKGEGVSFTTVMSSSDVYYLNLAGTQYKLFVQPVRLSLYEKYKAGVKTESDQSWSLCGLVQADRFRSESLAISYTLLLLFLFLFAVVLGSWPLLKLWGLGPADRLRHADVILVSMSVLLISGLVTFFLLDFYASAQLETQLDDQLKQFAKSIDERLDQELGQLCGLLDRTRPAFRADTTQVKTRILCVPKGHDPSGCDSPEWLDNSAPYFEMITLVGTGGKDDGKQIGKWTTEQVSTPLIDVSSRDYFRNIKEGRAWTKKFDNGTFSFFLEPILSLNTGETLAELAMPTPPSSEGSVPEYVITVIPKLLSLRETILPPGFGYAVIDDTGQVLFHSDLKKTLVENFFQECDNDRKLRAYVYARASDFVNAPYTGLDHRLFVKPLKDLPMTLVVFRDREIARTLNLELLSASLIFYVLYGIVFLLPVALYCLWHPDWMRPHAGQDADYRHLLAANLALVVVSLADFLFAYRHHFPALAFILPPFALLMNYLKLRGGTHVLRYKSHPCSLLLIALPILYLALGLRDNADARHPMLSAVTVIQVLLLYLILAFVFYPQGWFFPRILRFVKGKEENGQSFSVPYLLAGVSLVVLMGVLPALAFFRVAYDGEMEVLIKHGQLNLARSLVERDARVKDQYRQVRMPAHYLDRWLNDPTVNMYSDFFFETNFKEDSSHPVAACPSSSEKRLFDEWMEKIRPLYNEVAIQTHELVHDQTADCAYQWEPDTGGRIQLVKWPAPAPTFQLVSSKVPVLRWPREPGWSLGLAAVVLLFLVGIYVLVRFVANKIFLLNLTLPTRVSAEVTDLGEVTENTLVLGIPHSGKSGLLSRPGFHVVDIRLIAAAGTWEQTLKEDVQEHKGVIALDHFDYALDDPGCNGQKLRLLEKFFFANRTLVVASSAYPMDFPIGPPRREDSEGEKEGQAPKAREAGDDHLVQLYMDRWAAVWSTFTRRVYAAKDVKSSVPEKDLEASISFAGLPPSTGAELFRECRATGPLRRMGVEIVNLHRGSALSDEQLIDEVLDRASAYYRALWATCSRGEKRALLYLAEDGFVNATYLVLRRLVERGLVDPAPPLRLMNESFRRFVVETGRAEDVAAVPEEGWNLKKVIRGTVVTAMIGVAIILFVTQPQLLTLSITFIGAAVAGIPAVLKLFDLIRGAQTSE